MASFLSTPVLAYSAGVTGRTGKPGPDGSPSQVCTRCHVVAADVGVPTVEISGPATVMAGSTNQYTFIIRGGPAKIGGVDLAVDGAEAALDLVENSGLRKAAGELTHSTPKAFTDGEVRFDFSMIAPATGGMVTIYGAGNSANGADANKNDGVAATKLEVTVQAADGADAGTGSGTDAGTGTGSDPGNDDNDKGGGCSSTGGAPLLMFALGTVGLTLLRRRRA